MSNIPFIIYLLFAMHIFWFGAAGAWLVYNHREQHDRSRLYIAITFFYLAVGCIIFIATGMARGDLDGFIHTILEPYPLMISFLPVLTFSLYLLEIMHPKWITWKRFLILISPWMALSAVWLTYHGIHGWHYDAITHLGNVREIMPAIHKTDVLLRVLLAAIYFPYSCAILFVRYNWRISNVNGKTLWVMKGLIVLICLGFIIGMVLRVPSVIFAYFIVLDTLTIYIIFIENTARIPVPISIGEDLDPQSGATATHEVSLLAQRIQQQMDLKIWQDPDLDRDDMCRLLGTNRTYLAAAIHELGYANFHNMVNQQRAQYVHDELLRDPSASLSDIIFCAGFRNRITAVNSFKQVYNCTLSDFIRGGGKFKPQ